MTCERGMSSGWIAAVLTLCVVQACGEADAKPGSATAGTAGTGDASGGNGGTGGGGTGGAGTGGTAAGGRAGSGGTSGSIGTGGGDAGTRPDSCATGWGNPVEVYRVDPGDFISSPTLSPNELEMFYVHTETGEPGRPCSIRRSVRGSLSESFRAGETVTELANATMCSGDWHCWIDLSADGLRAYIECSFVTVHNVAELRVARRTAIGAPFVLDEEPMGVLGEDFGMGPDELVAYSYQPIGNGGVSLHVSTRSSVAVPFLASGPVPGLGPTALGAPDPSADGLWLFGTTGDLVAAGRDRPGAPFGAPQIVAKGDSQAGVSLTDPEVTRDCRRLYYVHRESTAVPTFGIRMLTR